jgi:hypothetical protein
LSLLGTIVLLDRQLSCHTQHHCSHTLIDSALVLLSINSLDSKVGLQISNFLLLSNLVLSASNTSSAKSIHKEYLLSIIEESVRSQGWPLIQAYHNWKEIDLPITYTNTFNTFIIHILDEDDDVIRRDYFLFSTCHMTDHWFPVICLLQVDENHICASPCTPYTFP